MSMCRVFTCVGKGCLLWPVCSLGKTLLACDLLHSVLQGQTCLLLQVSLDFLLLRSSPLLWKWHLLGVLVLEGLVGLHRTIQLQLLQHYCSGHLTWITVILNGFTGNDQRSFCWFWDCIQLLHFGASLVAEMVKHLPTMQENWVWSLGQEDPLEKEMETHSSTLAWKIPWMEEHGRLQSMGPQRVEQDWVTSLSLHFRLFYWLWWLLHFF